jgi:hypothetical protein
MSTYKQIGRNEFPSADPTRLGKTDVAYAYMDENLKTIMITVPLENDTEETVESELRARVERSTTAGPKEVTI